MASRKAFVAPLNSKWASSRKKTSLGLSRSPASGRSSKRSASSHMRNVEKSMGLVCSVGSSRQLTTPRPSGAVRSSSAVSNSGSPKNFSIPCASSVISSRRITPAVALERPPSSSSSSLPSAEVRNWITARRSLRSISSRSFLSAKWKTSCRLDSWVSFRSMMRESRMGPKEVMVARTGMPLPSPPRARNSTGKVLPDQAWPMLSVRARSFSEPVAAVARPERSPLMSARNTGTPAVESCSAIMCSVTVLPVPVAPATRPCRFIIASGSRTEASLWSSPSTIAAPSSIVGPSRV